MPEERVGLFSMVSQHTRNLMLAMAVVVLGIVAAGLIDVIFAPTPESEVVLAYGDFKERVLTQQVTDVWTDGSTIEGRLTVAVRQQGGSSRVSRAFISKMPASGDPQLVADLKLGNVRVNPPQVTFYWDFISSATAFSTLAAVLAGFVIIAIVAILTFDPKLGEVPKHVPIPALLTAFLSLVVAAFLYAVVAGNRMAAGVDLAMHAEGFSLSWILALGVVQTCVGVTWMLSAYGMPKYVVQAAVGICHCAVAIAAVSTSGLLVLPLYELYGGELVRNTIAWAFTFFVLGLSIPVGRLLARGLSARDQKALMDGLTIPALVSILFATALFSVLTGMGNGAVRDLYGLVFGTLVFFQLALGFGFGVYEASLPITPPGTFLGRWVEGWVKSRGSEQRSLGLG